MDVGGVYKPDVLDPALFHPWVLARQRYEVTRTYCDEPMPGLNVPAFTQEHLRLRVASTTFQQEEDGLPETYDHATHYSYDIHGNVKELVQDHPQMALDVGGSATDPMRYKRLKYRYDLVSGNVREVKYQEGHHDQFFHRYAYDADNRITKAETSLDASLWHVDAEYFYYPHGPLQRVELGEHKVQGMDHAYTLQGWLKGINSEVLSPEADQGQDGWVAQGNANALVGRDAFGLSLSYHGNDYRPIDLTRWGTGANDGSRPLALQAWGTPEWAGLYNGNIAGTVHSLQPFGVGGWQGTAGEVGQALAGLYRYDQLNRLREMRTRAGLTDGNDWTEVPAPTGADLDTYRSSYTYDANGNILAADRWDQSGAQYDALAYGYKEGVNGERLRNRLYQVDDLADQSNALVNAGPGEDAEDIGYTGSTGFDPQATNIETAYNYHYDELGNLVHDAAAHIDDIQWTVAGKVKRVDHATGQGPDLEFAYDAGGQRISKQVGGTVGDPGTYREHYIRDAQGNIMATYRLHANGAFRLQERPIYGSSRVGLYAAKVDLYPAGQIVPLPQVIPVFDGLLRYELNDHLGNVGTVVTGRLLPGQGAPHEAEVISAQGYEPFGSLLPGRNYSSDSYRFGFNGKENDNEWHGATGTLQDYGMRAYDTRVGRFFTVDPIAYQYPMLTPYQFASNMPIAAIDLDGLEAYVVVFPDYKIATPLGRIGGLGHAGSLIVDPSSGDAYYVEYGRYDKEGKGIARTIGDSHKVGSVSFGDDGLPTEASLANVLGVISTLAGHGGRIEAAEVPVTQDEFSRAKEMHERKLEDNSNPNRAPYKLQENNCGTFSCDVVKDSKTDSNIPDKYSPKPSKMIRQVLATGATRVGYDPKTKKAQRGGEYIPSKDEKDTESLIGE